jgi:uncharacterized RDD family membrane protein YckC
VETSCRCHSCGTEVSASTRRCPHCYVALEAASRAPAPLRAAPTASASVAATGAGSSSAAAAVIAVEDAPPLPVGVRCPSCEATVLPLAGWCSYCMDPLPVEGAAVAPGWDSAAWDSDGWDLDPDPAPEAPGGQVIAGPWPDRPVGVRYASYRQRAVATLIDASVFVVPAVALAVNATIGVILLLAAIVFSGWQLWHQGRSGQTIGKSQVGIFLVGESDLAPIGTRRTFLRQLAHAIDATLFGVGYLWPLWDPKHQTFADQLLATVVVEG